MDAQSYKTVSLNSLTADKKWVIVDVEGKVLGRAASQIATILRGKNKPSYTPHVDCGDNVIVINADKIRLTGKKWDQKEYIHYTGYPSGQRTILAKDLMRKNPRSMVETAVRGMLPKTRLGRTLFTNLRVYAGTEHPHVAQTPEIVEII
jgi:large subunit ribosomal protein L13